MGKVFTDGQVLTANDANTYLQAVASMVPEVSGTGVTVDTATGIVTFASATTISINDAFSTNYRNYRINLESSGTAATVVFRLRAANVNSSASYDRTEILARNAGVTSSTTLNAANATVCEIANTLIQGDIEISGPALPIPTTIISRFGAHANPAASSTANGVAINFVTHRPSTAFDGFEIIFSAAQSGTIRIYGYN
jgi:hypothetical protein